MKRDQPRSSGQPSPKRVSRATTRPSAGGGLDAWFSWFRGMTEPAPPSPVGGGVPVPSMRRRWVFRLSAMVFIPAFLLAGLELVLRLIGYGYPTGYWVRNPVRGQTTLVANRQFSRRYFPPEWVRLPQPAAFSPAKPAGACRIFVFGESAAEGDPGPAFGFARMLEVLLREHVPGKQIEVINTAVTAINSHVILPMARNCAPYAGDVWMLYLGNNEVVGPFGAGTVFSPQTPSLAMVRASLALKTTKTGQLVDDLGYRVRASQSRAPLVWEGMEMFLEQQVAQDDARLAAVYANFERNLADLVRVGIRSGARMLVSTVASNLRDCAPFASRHRAGMSDDERRAWGQFYQAGVAYENEGNQAAALAQYLEAARLDRLYADLQFRLGRCQLALGRPVEARRHFEWARDGDALRFRADGRLNEILRRAATGWSPAQVRCLDIEAALARASRDGIPGEDMFYDHVHLTFQGNYLLARQCAGQVAAWLEGMDAAGASVGEKPFLSQAECARRLAFTEWDHYKLREAMWRRLCRPPFTRQLDRAARLGLGKALAQAGRGLEACQEYAEAVRQQPDDYQARYTLANALASQNQVAAALEHYAAAVRLRTNSVEARNNLGTALASLGKTSEALEQFLEAVRLKPDFIAARLNCGAALAEQGRWAEARAHFEAVLRLEPNNPRARQGLEKLGGQTGRKRQ